MFVKRRQVALSRFGIAGIAVCVLTFGVAQIGATVSAAPHLQAPENENQTDRPALTVTSLQGQPLASQGNGANDIKKLPALLPATPAPTPAAVTPATSTTSTTAFTPLTTQLILQAIKNNVENADKARRAIAANIATTPTVPPTTVTTTANPPAAATTQTHPSATVAPATHAATPAQNAVATPIPMPATAAATAPATPSAPVAAASIQAKPFIPTRASATTPGKPIGVSTRHHTLLTAKLAVGTGAGLLLIALATAVVIRNRRRHSENDPLDDFIKEETPPALTPETAPASVDKIDLTEIDMKKADDKVIDDLIAELIDVTSGYTNAVLSLDLQSTEDFAESELDIEDEDEIGKHYAEFDHAPVRFSFTISPA